MSDYILAPAIGGLIAHSGPVSHTSGWWGAFMVIMIGWAPIYLGILFIVRFNWLSDRAVNYFLYIALGLMLFLFASSLAGIVDMAKETSPGTRSLIFVGGFMFGAGALLLYNEFKHQAFKGPMDRPMQGEFPQKVFLLDWTATMGKGRANFYPISFAIALGIGLHGLGEGLLMSNTDQSIAEGVGYTQYSAIFMHKLVEGLGIAAPIAKMRFNIKNFIVLGAIAGFPLLIGFWIGGINSSPVLTLALAAMAAGIIFYGFVMLAEVSYLTYRPDISPVGAFLFFIGSFSIFFGVYLFDG
ncbi:hypothetical protein MNBD_NITROSPINAE02-165 [hydrothermal vent metagenome]|uniref:Metal transporter, ZIP family n=1 Tax=hydrothermal vent metagenome TaxID=652676 RepID=A0A3B1BTS4_9ZZZZ